VPDPVPEPRYIRPVVARLDRLLDMMYTVDELSAELGISVSSIRRSYIPAGAPHKTIQKRMMISGLEFAAWARDYLSASHRGHNDHIRMTADQAYCLRCHKAVELQLTGMHPHAQKPGVVYLLGTCPICGFRLSRMIRKAVIDGQQRKLQRSAVVS
jgi:hypothetical protein